MDKERDLKYARKAELPGRRAERESFLEYVRKTELPALAAGDAVYGNILQRVFLKCPEEQQLQTEIAAAYEKLLSKISAEKLIRLSEIYRKHCEVWFSTDDTGEWWLEKPRREDYPYLTENQYYAVLKLGTFLNNGFDRQWCMEALDGAPGTLPFFFLRLNDWVGAIRGSAFVLAEKRLMQCGVEELFFSLPMLEKVIFSGRRDEKQIRLLEALVKERTITIFQEIPYTLLTARLPYYGVKVKNAVYRLLSRNKLLPLEQMEQLLAAEWTGYGKKLLLDGIFRHYGYDRERTEKYLGSKNTLIRYRALWFRYENEQTAWPGLEKLLLDRARKIRSSAGFILQRHTDIRILDFYLEELRRNVSGAVLSGLGEYGTKNEIPAIMPFLGSEVSQTARAALVSYGRLAAEDGWQVYWRFLFDGRPTVAKSAYRLILKNRIHYGAAELYDMLCRHRQEVIRKYLFRLLLCEPSWELLPYLLTMYTEWELSDEEKRGVECGIGGRFAYAVVSKEQEQRILAVLEKAGEKIPEAMRKGILFDLSHVVKR